MSKNNLITSVAIVSGIAVVVLFFIVGNPFISNSMFQNNQAASALGTNQVTQLVAQDEAVGTGAEANTGSVVTVHYTGKLQDGTVFDTSVGRSPITFTLGAGQVIQGWEQGLQGMKAGGKRLLIIPAALGYGANGYGPIPPNAPLIFEVELVSVGTPGATQ